MFTGTKKTVMVLVALMVVMFGSVSNADILPTLVPETTPVPEAPSYGKMADVGPAQIVQENGKTVVTYADVPESGYTEFGEYMGSLGYTSSDVSVEGRRVTAKLSNGVFDIDFSYDADQKMLVLKYMAGISFERAICSTCHGTGKCVATAMCIEGKCRDCKGTGFYLCVSCNGDGLCRWCKGTGLRDNISMYTTNIFCGFCEGTGMCSHCEGSGHTAYKCSTCEGSGACVVCHGTYQCQSCFGTGVK